MQRTIKDLNSLQYPIYKIPSDDWYTQDNIVYIGNRIVDDLNRPGKSIGIRRLQSKRSAKELVRLNAPIFSAKEIIQSRKRFFIASDGKPFEYIKTGFQMIKYHVIKEVIPKGDFSLLVLRGISLPLEIPRPPSDINFISWARVLYYNGFPWVVYDYSKLQGKDCRIKV